MLAAKTLAANPNIATLPVIFEDIVSDGEHTILFSTHVISDLEKCAGYL